MKKIIPSIWLWILLLSIWVFTWINISLEKKLNIENIKRSIVVIIPEENLVKYNTNPKWVFNEKESWWIGAGFFISEDGKIVTAKHIVPNSESSYKITTHNKQTYNAKVIYQDPEKDIAILQINTSKKTTPLKITNEIKKWEEVISFWTHRETLETIFHYGHIVDTEKKWENLSHLIQISSQLTPWFSWWPVINTKWKVVWINYATSKEINLITPFHEDLEQYYQ
jgi:S1-C subfamily serine protease